MTHEPTAARTIVVMGVCGCGKTTFGAELAARLGAEFIEGDRLHPRANVDKMSRGEALDDADRIPWLEAIVERTRELAIDGTSVVVACSALKRSYRDLLRAAGPRVEFVHLAGPIETVLERVGARRDHFMPASLVESQYATLEATDDEADVTDLDLARDLSDNLDRYLQSRSEA